jgi:hypothetical protein
MERLGKQIMEEREREAARHALAAQHSRSGMLRRFLKAITGRVDVPAKEVR